MFSKGSKNVCVIEPFRNITSICEIVLLPVLKLKTYKINFNINKFIKKKLIVQIFSSQHIYKNLCCCNWKFEIKTKY